MICGRVGTGFEARQTSDNLEIGARVSTGIRHRSKQHNIDTNPNTSEFLSQRSTIASIVSLATKNLRLFAGEVTAKMGADGSRTSLRSGLHK